LTAVNVPPIDVHRRIKVVCGDDCAHISEVGRLPARACDRNLGYASVNDKERSGRPRAATDEVRRNYVGDMIKENRRVSQHATANKISVSRV
jgi:hypothetical protein